MNSRIAIGLACAGAMLTAGCHKNAPQGQVAAMVNGKEVTLQEVNTELQAQNVPDNADKQTVQRALLQRVIDRKLLVSAAEDKGIDKTPDYLAQKRRLEELLLAQTYAKQQLATVPVPTQADIDKFMADHGNVFSQREMLQLDQIRFAPPPNTKALAALQQDHSLNAVAATLTGLGIKFDRAQAGLDTGQLPFQVLQKINKMPAGEPFVIPQPGMVTVNVLLGRKPIPIDMTKARPAAVAQWREQKFGEIINKQIASLRSGAKITYQPGFAPPKPGDKPAAAPKP